MKLSELMAGIAVVIDDKIESAVAADDSKEDNSDLIIDIVRKLEQEWNVPFYQVSDMPPHKTWSNLLQAASFVVLDWELWPSGSSELERAGIENNIRFLKQAKDYFVPVFIFTNEAPEDVVSKLPEIVYQEDYPEKNFVFIRSKTSLVPGDSLDTSAIEEWITKNASVYALKTWGQAFHIAKRELFSSMYSRNADWPRVFWKAYEEDSVDPSSSLTHLINDNLRGRIQTNVFEAAILSASYSDIPKEELLDLIAEASFRAGNNLPPEEIRCGDLFRLSQGKYLLNIRPDCDCVSRGVNADEVELYCIEGERMRDSELCRQYSNGHFSERIWESVAFAVFERRSVRFDFRKLLVKTFSEVKDRRIGRMLHPYLTGIQQRYALYLQRQGLPRIPEEAVRTPGG